ncbi:hypothetical protein JKF63_06195 [Porcisia hertigi]|uniref:Uncharacterized protein n=1 Tax=Porcisia hertigi TaxID=2761500 RepID=A0A836IPL0_9TRYP|nr:hypothetical protein JKF63_06195 [Porcisia hertigi]
MSLQTQTQRGSHVAATGAIHGKSGGLDVTIVPSVEAISVSMANFLDSQEAALGQMLDFCWGGASHIPPLGVVGDVAAESQQTKDTQASAGHNSHGTVQACRAGIIAEVLQHEKASQQVFARGRLATKETQELRRLAELERDKLRFAQTRNRLLRGRLARLTRELQDKERCTVFNHNGDIGAVVDGKQTPTFLNDSSPTSYEYTNDTVEARRQLDQCTKELEESQLRLHQEQQYHLGQLSGHLRPMMTAQDALRTTENFLDPETNLAVRATVVDSLLEVNRVLKPLLVQRDGLESLEGALPFLANITTLWDRLAVQNFVVWRINRLFTCMCPTAPPLTLLKDTNMM